MWHLDIPTESELRLLATISPPAVVSIYLPTTPISQDAAADAWVLHNLVKEAMSAVRQQPDLLQLIAATTAQDAHVLCLSEGAVRLIDVAADLPPREVKVADLPTDAASAIGKSSINDRSPSGRLVGSEGKRVRIRQYARAVDDALMPLLRGGHADPLPRIRRARHHRRRRRLDVGPRRAGDRRGVGPRGGGQWWSGAGVADRPAAGSAAALVA